MDNTSDIVAAASIPMALAFVTAMLIAGITITSVAKTAVKACHQPQETTNVTNK